MRVRRIEHHHQGLYRIERTVRHGIPASARMMLERL